MAGLVLGLRTRSHSGDPWHLAHQAAAERVDRLDAEARGMLNQLPLQFAVPLERAQRKPPGLLLVRLVWLRSGSRSLQGADDPMPHFAGGLLRKRDGDDGFRLLHKTEQSEETLNQEFGLS